MTDDGLKFFATIHCGHEELRHRETGDRRALLAWVDAHLHAEDELTLTVEATGAAAVAMLAAVRFGLHKLDSARRQTRNRS